MRTKCSCISSRPDCVVEISGRLRTPTHLREVDRDERSNTLAAQSLWKVDAGERLLVGISTYSHHGNATPYGRQTRQHNYPHGGFADRQHIILSGKRHSVDPHSIKVQSGAFEVQGAVGCFGFDVLARARLAASADAAAASLASSVLRIFHAWAFCRILSLPCAALPSSGKRNSVNLPEGGLTHRKHRRHGILGTTRRLQGSLQCTQKRANFRETLRN